MERLKALFNRQRDEAGDYQPLDAAAALDGRLVRSRPEKRPVDWLEYGIFVLLGVAMLWSWNMFLAAAPYFQARFASSEDLLTHFQSSIISVSTVTTLASTAVLTKLQANASYPKRVAFSLALNIGVFVVLAILTVAFLDISPQAYFVILLFLVFASSLATGFCQNGVFAFASGSGTSEYTQAVMTGQGLAGVAPCIVQIVSVLSVPLEEQEGGGGETGLGGFQESPRSACAYFGTAAVVSVVALLAFGLLLKRNPMVDKSKGVVVVPAVHADGSAGDIEDDNDDLAEDPMMASQLSQRKVAGLWRLFLKLRWLAPAVLVAFAVTMQYAVYTQKILSVKDPETAPRLFQPVAFIPLGYLFWNTGDLIGKTAPVVPLLNLVDKPKTVFALSLARTVFIPMYHLCNIGGHGAVIQSDFFYLFILQFLFGFTGGWVSTICMMGPSYWVEEPEREAAGGFMVLILVVGLSIGSVISFAAS